ncbi:MAG: hypothetical protein QM535_00345 [Limnohabitans sp.]|nr:hypothetical protein [Limnohabitans sp.]
MRKSYLFLIALLVFFCSFSMHKFYVSIYQIKFVPEKKALHITSRIFMDDLNAVLSKKYNQKVRIGDKEESQKDIELMKKYILERFIIKVNGKPATINYLSNEKESNVLICYYKVVGISKIKEIEIENTSLFEIDETQQNIIQTTIYNKKQDLLLSAENVKGLLKN